MTIWTLKASCSGQARLRLFCFPYSGAGASIWRLWPDALAPVIDVIPVQLPGRENRLREKPATSFADLLPEIERLLLEKPDVPYAVMGHSMGAHLAFALVEHMSQRGLTLPIHAVLSGRRPIHIAPQPPVSHLPDDIFVRTIMDKYGDGNLDPDLLQLMLPTLRADLRMTETWPAPASTEYPVDLTVLGGDNDPWVDPATLDAWHDYFSGDCTTHLFPGGHFFVHEQSEEVIRVVRDRLLASLEDQNERPAAP